MWSGPSWKVLGAHPFGPGAVDADGELRGRVGLAGDLDDPGRQPDLLLLGEAEEVARRRRDGRGARPGPCPGSAS